MRVAVTGDRDYPGHRYEEISRELAKLSRENDVVILGDAAGVDSLARMACERLKLEHIICHAKWDQFGKGAGPKRNAEMLDHNPDEVWWWHHDYKHSKGTRNMLGQAVDRGVKVVNKTPRP